MRNAIAIVVVGLLVLAGGLWAHAQVQTPNNPRVLPNPIVPPPAEPSQPMIVSGNDVGFRIEGWDGSTPIGRWVLRIDGQWVEVRTAGGIRRLTSR